MTTTATEHALTLSGRFERTDLLAPTPPSFGSDHPRHGIRLSAANPNRLSEVGLVQVISHRRGMGGRMFDDNTGGEGDFAVLNPEPQVGREYIGWPRPDEPQHYLRATRTENGWLLTADSESALVPSREVPHDHLLAWALAAAEVSSEDVPATDVPEAVAAPPAWLSLVQRPEPRPNPFGRGIILVTAAPTRPELVGTFRSVDRHTVTHEGVAYYQDRGPAPGSPASAPVAVEDTPLAGAWANTRHTVGTYHLLWEDRDPAMSGAAPVIAALSSTSYAFEVVADAEGNPVTPRRVTYSITVPTYWTPAPGRAFDAGEVECIRSTAESFWGRWSDAMNEVAQESEWCPEYERAVIPLGFEGRGEMDWDVRVSVVATLTIDNPSSHLDRLLSSETGLYVEATRVRADVSLTVSGTVSGMRREDVEDEIDTSTVETWLENNYGYEWEVDDWSIEEITASE